MIYIDIETLDLFSDPHIKRLPRNAQIAAMRFGLAVTYDSANDQWREWVSDDITALYTMLIEAAQPVAGWNIDNFDLPVIVANARRAGIKPKKRDIDAIETLDIFARIRDETGRWYKLDVIAEANLDRHKSADGLLAVEWLRAGDPESVAKAMAYCKDDVQIVVDLVAKLARGEPLRLPPRPERREYNELAWRLLVTS